MRKCDHCLLEISDSRAVYDVIKGQEVSFCCHGCRGIARLISDEGLEEFYKRRNSSWIPGPPEDNSVDPSVFSATLKQDGYGMEVDMVLDGIRCASCIWLIEKIMLRTEGVTYAKVNYASHRAKLRWSPALTDISRIVARIKSTGYTPKPFFAKGHDEELKRQQRDLLIRLGTASFFSIQLMMYSIALYAGYFQGISAGIREVLQLISLILTTPVLFYSGMPFIKGAIRSLRNLAFNMDVLIITGAGSAYIYSVYQIFSGGEVYFDTAAMIITLILLGRYIETGAKGRASEVITRLLSLNPKEVKAVKTSGAGVQRSELVTLSSIQKDDLVQITPGERIPLDGIVIDGMSEVDESMLTGESRPVTKRPGSEVFCGTQNLFGNLIFQVQRTGDDTVLAQIIKTVEDAQTRRAPIQALADSVVGVFVPMVLLLSMGTAISWLSYGRDAAEAFMIAVSVLVIACPCALGLATPLAILIGTMKGASKGILIKGGDIIERAKNIDTVVLDKTGTITEGKSELLSYAGIGISDEESLHLAFSLERLSEHSIAQAIVNAAKGAGQSRAVNVSVYPGKGIGGEINGKTALIGNRRFIESEGIFDNIDRVVPPELLSWIGTEESSGATVVYLSYDKGLAGVFVIADTIRSEAREAVSILKKMGYEVIMITGDEEGPALTIGRATGIDEGKIMAQRSPVDKAEKIKEMQNEGREVIMVGDGINDAPALVQADVGIAMGRATDIALESADMVLVRSDLGLVSDAIRLSRRIYMIIRQNLFWAFIYNVVALPLAVAGLLHPIVAVASMTLSSLSVVGNSMRLKKG